MAWMHAVAAFLRTKRLARRLRTSQDVRRWQQHRVRAFLARSLPAVPYYAGTRAAQLDDLPVMDKTSVAAAFERLNTCGVTLEEARRALDRSDERVRGLIVGQSTGTTGNRGVYVISEAERFAWLGMILAKTAPQFPFVKRRVALVLPSYGALYGSVAETRRIALRFFDLGRGVEYWRDELRAYQPDTIVAPPKVLRFLAEDGGLHPQHVFSGAEVLDPIDRAIVEAAFGVTVREIYMATEGLFGVACALGVLHLAEDAVAFEWEPVPGSDGLVVPVITDFVRTTQIMARYRMNDLLRLRDAPCACGSPLRAIEAIEGRTDDVLYLARETGGDAAMVTPDVVRNAIVDADRRILDFRVVQAAAGRVDVWLPADLPPEAAAAASASLTLALRRAGAGGVEVSIHAGIDIPVDRKLRRVRRDWQPVSPAG
jgi:putative adenylate-forming enzyme